jgi:hypothetical protein
MCSFLNVLVEGCCFLCEELPKNMNSLHSLPAAPVADKQNVEPPEEPS